MTSSSRATSSRAGQLARLGVRRRRRAPSGCWPTRRWPGCRPVDDVFGDVRRRRRSARRRRPRPGAARPGPAAGGAASGSTTTAEHSVRELVATLRDRGPARAGCSPSSASSVALGDHLVAHPGRTGRSVDRRRRGVPADELRAELLAAVGADPAARRAGRDGVTTRSTRCGRLPAPRCCGIAATDLTARTRRCTSCPRRPRRWPTWRPPRSRRRSRSPARSWATPPTACRLAVIGMGKCGGRELNYVSDVDVIFVAEPRRRRRRRPDATRDRGRRHAARRPA